MDNRDEELEEEREESGIPDYDEMKTEEPELPIPDGYLVPRTLTEAEGETPHSTDIQAILKALTPEVKNARVNEICKTSMVTRIPPDVMMDKHFLIAASTIEEQCYDEEFDPVMIISQTQDLLLIGSEGRGIIDRLEIAGVVHEAEMERISKELGL